MFVQGLGFLCPNFFSLQTTVLDQLAVFPAGQGGAAGGTAVPIEMPKMFNDKVTMQAGGML